MQDIVALFVHIVLGKVYLQEEGDLDLQNEADLGRHGILALDHQDEFHLDHQVVADQGHPGETDQGHQDAAGHAPRSEVGLDLPGVEDHIHPQNLGEGNPPVHLEIKGGGISPPNPITATFSEGVEAEHLSGGKGGVYRHPLRGFLDHPHLGTADHLGGPQQVQ